jgi:hypothetical protein
MDLSDVYSQQVKPSRIPLTGLPASTTPPTFIRDPEASAFERKVFAQLRSVIPVEYIETPEIPKAPVVNHVSFEDALRELAALNNK